SVMRIDKSHPSEKLTLETIGKSLRAPMTTHDDHPDSHLIAGLVGFCFDETSTDMSHLPAYAIQR
ncbi:hypothetical protein LJD47_33175, partial [Escherichia coli]|nr:hypothetical protein [Escherichia coli]